jgi:hypothetical protein
MRNPGLKRHEKFIRNSLLCYHIKGSLYSQIELLFLASFLNI